MATEADASFTEQISPELVGHAFVTQYYEILHREPEEVYRFYNDQSTMSRPDPSGNLVTVSAMEEIKDVFLSLDCKNNKAEIFTADTQASHMNGVTVLVTGCLTGQDNVRRNFAESFFLAPQDGGYFVLNDTFRFMAGSSLPSKESVEEHPDKSVAAAPVSAVALVQETVDAVDKSLGNNTAAVKEIVVTAAVPVVQKEKAVSSPPSAIPPVVEAVSKVVEAVSNGDVEAPKKSYADSLRRGVKEGVSASPVHVTAPAKPVKRTVPAKPVARVGQQTQAATVPAASGFSTDNGSHSNARSNGHATSNGHAPAKASHSIYVGQLPSNATPELLEQEFKSFGRIKKNGIQVRSNKHYTFGFVEFEDASAQADAIQVRKMEIGGRKVYIEKKKTDDENKNGSRNDNRRDNYSNGRGYSRNDSNKYNGDVPASGRGNGNGNGNAPNHSGGGRGNGNGYAPNNSGGGRGGGGRQVVAASK